MAVVYRSRILRLIACVCLTIVFIILCGQVSINDQVSLLSTPKLSAEGYLQQGLAYVGSLEPKKAIESFTNAIYLKPDYANAYYERGRLRVGKLIYLVDELPDLQGAIEDFDQAIKLNSTQAAFYFSRGDAHIQLNNDLSRALDDFEQAIHYAPDYSEAYLQRGLIYSKLNRKKEAVSDYLKALQFFQSNLQPQYTLNQWQKYIHRESLNRAILKASQLVDENFELAHFYCQGLAQLYIGEVSEFTFSGSAALNSFTQAIKIEPNLAEAWLYRGHSRPNSDEKGKIEDYTQSLNINSSLADAYYSRAKVRGTVFYSSEAKESKTLRNARNKYKSFQDYSQAISADPTFADAYYQRGLMFSQQGNQQAAIEDYIQALRTDPLVYTQNQEIAELFLQALLEPVNVPEAYYRRGLVQANLRDDGGALLDYSQAISLNSQFADAFYQRGLIFLFRSNLPGWQDEKSRLKALQDFEQALKYEPQSAESYLARGLSKLDDFNGQINDYTQALKLNSMLAEAYYARAIAYLANDPDATDGNKLIYLEKEVVKNFLQGLEIDFANPPLSEIWRWEILNKKVDLFVEYWIKEQQISFFQAQITQKIVQKLNQILEQDPTNSDAYYDRGLIHLQNNEFSAALDDLTQAIRLNPYAQSALLFYYRGLTFYHKQDFQRSLSDFTKAIELDPYLVEPYVNRSLTKYALGDKIGTILDATRSLQLQPLANQVHFIRGLAYYDVGKHRNARIDHEIAGLFFLTSIPVNGVSLLTVNASYYFDQGRIFAQRGDNSRALKFLQIAANAFRVQGKIERYREAQALLKQLKH